MPKANFCLQAPAPAYYGGFLDMAAEFHAAGELDWPHGAWSGDRLALDDFAAYLRQCSDQMRGVNLAAGQAPNTTYWLLVHGPAVPETGEGERLVGTLNLRHTLTEAGEYEGGHMGYCVRPAERGRGYAKAFVRLALEAARGFGVRRALITCTKDNRASAAVIRACGGVLEDERISMRHTGEIVQRYWVELGARLPRCAAPG